MNERETGREVKLWDKNGWGWVIKEILYVDETVEVVETRENLQHILSEFERACDSMGLKINVGKCKVLVVEWEQSVYQVSK